MSQLVDVMHVVDRAEEVLHGRWQNEFRHHFEYVLECLAEAVNEEQGWFGAPWESLLEPEWFDLYFLELGARSEAIFFRLKQFLDMSIYSKELGQFQEYPQRECHPRAPSE